VGRPVIVVSSRNRPHELVLLGLSAALGLAYLVTVPPPQSLAALVPAWLATMWSLGLFVSGVLGLFAALWRGAIRFALEVERVAMLVSTGALLLIGGASFVVSGWRALFGASLAIAWAAANIVRSGQIRRDLAKIITMEGGHR